MGTEADHCGGRARLGPMEYRGPDRGLDGKLVSLGVGLALDGPATVGAIEPPQNVSRVRHLRLHRSGSLDDAVDAVHAVHAPQAADQSKHRLRASESAALCTPLFEEQCRETAMMKQQFTTRSFDRCCFMSATVHAADLAIFKISHPLAFQR